MRILDLHFTKLGSGHPLIILHGLYGSGSNWLSIAKKLAGICEVYVLDQRNHGRSPHSNEHNYSMLMEDLRGFMDDQGISKAILLGHSMGGKTAMYMATHYPHRVSKLIIADIGPLSYIGEHKHIMHAMKALDFSKITNLRDADRELETAFPDRRMRQFLMKNLSKDKSGSYFWRLNLSGLMRNLHYLADGLNPDSLPTEGFKQFPALFIKGANSNYIGINDENAISRIFPNSKTVSIPDAGHWLHAEQPEAFVRIVKQFLLEY